MEISVVVLAKNNENTIRKTLESLKNFSDVVVYDNGSTDKTINIITEYSNVNLIQGDFKGFGWTKNHASSFAKNDWILIIDSDEVVDNELFEILQNKQLDENTVYRLNFKAFYKDIQVNYCGWNNQKIKRLFNRKITRYNDNDVHEDIITEKLSIEDLKGNVEHYSYHTISQFIIKADRYSTLFALNNAGKKNSSPLKALLNAKYSFIKTYFFKRGFLDGYVGLVIAFSHAVTNFYKYIKLYELNREMKKMTILLTRHDKIGDFVTALPMAKVLKEQTNHKVVFLVSKVNVSLAQNLDFIDDVIEYTKDTKELTRRIKSVGADVSISGYIDTHLGYCLFKSRIKIRIAPATKLAQVFFNKKIKQRRSEVKMTEWQYNLELLKVFDESLVLNFKTPLVKFNIHKENKVIFHPGFGGSSDGNITLDEYLDLAKKASETSEVVFTFGPDDKESKSYICSKLDFDAVIKDDFKNIWDLASFISSSKLFVSTSTGPMHLAGLSNTNTLSFFGNSSFASSRRWATISDKIYQHNFEIPSNKTEEFYNTIESTMVEIIQNKG